VLLDHRQQVAEQGALVVGQLLGEVGERRNRRALVATGANARMTLAIGGSLRPVGPAPRRLRLRRGVVGALGLL
jgi:hypothetical protein